MIYLIIVFIVICILVYKYYTYKWDLDSFRDNLKLRENKYFEDSKKLGEERQDNIRELENHIKLLNEEYQKLGESLVLAINVIRSYPHHKRYPDESYYHYMLYGYMQNYFSNIEIEEIHNESRPDIVVGNMHIAIEVKGPTTSKDLDSIYGKCIKYPKYYKSMIIVLFDLEVKASTYDRWLENMTTHYPNIHIINKNL